MSPKIFWASWPRRAECSSVSMTSAEDARFSALRFHPASEWMNSAAEEFPPRFMACHAIFENFKRKYYNLKVRKRFSVFSAKVNPTKRWPNFWCDRTLCFGQLDAGRRSGKDAPASCVKLAKNAAYGHTKKLATVVLDLLLR